MAEPTIIRLSILSLAERLFQEGSLGEPLPTGNAAAKGREVHKRLQERGIEGYRAEVELTRSFQASAVRLEISGRADGIFERDGMVHIEEIKSTSLDLDGLAPDQRPAHLAQLGLYAWLHALSEGLRELSLDLVYVQRRSGKTRAFESISSLEELEERYGSALYAFLSWQDGLAAQRRELEAGLATLRFPFPDFRSGQREAAQEVFRSIREGGCLFLQAPTGIGKTMAVLFAGLKALGRGYAGKLFFFTAKSSGAAAAEKALAILGSDLSGLRWISITAKAKICFMRGGEGWTGDEGSRGWRPPCDAALCPYARDYFAKSRAALAEIGKLSSLDRAAVEELAREHLACPFELSLDLSLHCDVIVADYNYGFDPGVRLKRYFLGGATDFAFLVDEAHNLVDRARTMHSGSLSKRRVLAARRTAPPDEKKVLSGLNAALLALRKETPIDFEEARQVPPPTLGKALETTIDGLESLLERRSTLSPPVLELYWELIRLGGVLARYAPSTHRTLVSNLREDFRLDFLCIDPSAPLEETLGKQKASIFFSATLAPPGYFMRLLAPGPATRFVDLPAPFPPENCAYLADCRVSTRWRDRGRNLELYAKIVEEAFAAVPGNLLVFSPSFAFQDALLARLLAGGAMPVTWIAQRPAMAEEDRRAFVAAFEGDRGTRGFAVSGGSFAESVDLVGDRLVGVLVFGVGLPQVNAVNNLRRDFFEAAFGDGYDWAYLYPGLNRVIQAAGRVIRSATDRGFVLLVDERYETSRYRRLLPAHWELRTLRDPAELASLLPEGIARPRGDEDRA